MTSQYYEFWNEEEIYYKKFFSRMYKNDLKSIWKEIALRVINTNKDKITWIDIGSGDGSLLANVITFVNKGGKEIELTCIEPSVYVINSLKKNLSPLNIIINNKKFDASTKLIGKYDVITLMHSNYYFNIKHYKLILKKLLCRLSPGGRLIILTISEYGDFPKLGNNQYNNKLLAESTYKLLHGLNPRTTILKLQARFDSTEYIKTHNPLIIDELYHYEKFVKHNNHASFSQKRIKNFQRRISALSKKNGIRYFLNYIDCIIESKV